VEGVGADHDMGIARRLEGLAASGAPLLPLLSWLVRQARGELILTHRAVRPGLVAASHANGRPNLVPPLMSWLGRLGFFKIVHNYLSCIILLNETESFRLVLWGWWGSYRVP
jgi:hypothetical protein